MQGPHSPFDEELRVPLLPLSSPDLGDRDNTSAFRVNPLGSLLYSPFRNSGVASARVRLVVAVGILFALGGSLVLASLIGGAPNTARLAVDALYARQSTTLAEAAARYSLRTGRPPPPYYERWYRFAREKRCFIDEYAQIHRDFEPFYQLAADDPTYFQGMIDRASRELQALPAEIARVEIRDGEPYLAGDSPYGGDWPKALRHISGHLPDMMFLMNGRDEPRVAFNYRAPGARESVLVPNDSTPFAIEPHPSAAFFANHSGCTIPLEADGFFKSANGNSSFLLSTARPGFTTDLYPVLSMAKISPCFSDILFPTEYYYDRSWWSAYYSHPDDIPWSKKKSQAWWRGMSNGGMIIKDNYHHFARFKLIDIGRVHPDLMDVAMTTFAETLCEPDDCDREAVIAEYSITGQGEARENIYKYKYALDIDGTTFSGRFLGLLRSGSLVFKSTLFEEYFNDWLRPFEHYVPVRSDLSDLVQKIEWANAHPEEARLIQQAGLEVARRVLTDDQNDCYLLAVLIEWAQLQEYAKNQPA